MPHEEVLPFIESLDRRLLSMETASRERQGRIDERFQTADERLRAFEDEVRGDIRETREEVADKIAGVETQINTFHAGVEAQIKSFHAEWQKVNGNRSRNSLASQVTRFCFGSAPRKLISTLLILTFLGGGVRLSVDWSKLMRIYENLAELNTLVTSSPTGGTGPPDGGSP